MVVVANRPGLLHRASYNTYVGTTWVARSAPLQAIAADAGGLGWTLEPRPSDRSLRIAARSHDRRAALYERCEVHFGPAVHVAGWCGCGRGDRERAVDLHVCER